ncbi:arsenic resistance protein [Deferribacter desulfuricans]|uniref:arsenic resistance protein n=1 Tax=Deferribacter desulfuricans TaxID=197162 RepID=UPI000682B669|nr:bile acid:sodium symporter [Deferribacter desulfuricans]
MISILTLIRKKLYLFVFFSFILALVLGNIYDFSKINIKPISIFAVYLMLFPMLTSMEIEKIKNATKDYKLIFATLFLAFIVASLNAHILATTIFEDKPELALGLIIVGAIPCSNMLIGWSGIAEAKVESAFVIAVIGLLLIPLLSPIIIQLNGNTFININGIKIFYSLR